MVRKSRSRGGRRRPVVVRSITWLRWSASSRSVQLPPARRSVGQRGVRVSHEGASPRSCRCSRVRTLASWAGARARTGKRWQSPRARRGARTRAQREGVHESRHQHRLAEAAGPAALALWPMDLPALGAEPRFPGAEVPAGRVGRVGSHAARRGNNGPTVILKAQVVSSRRATPACGHRRPSTLALMQMTTAASRCSDAAPAT